MPGPIHYCNYIAFRPASSSIDVAAQTFAHSRREFMILRVGRRLVEKIDRLTAQPHPLAFEPDITDLRLLFVAVTPVVFEKQIQRARRVEQSSFDGDFLHFVALGELQRLRGRQIGRGREIESLAVDEEI